MEGGVPVEYRERSMMNDAKPRRTARELAGRSMTAGTWGPRYGTSTVTGQNPELWA